MSASRLFSQSGIAFRLLIKNLFINLVLCLLVFVCVLSCNYAWYQAREIGENYRIIASLKHEKTLLCMGYDLDFSGLEIPHTEGGMRRAIVSDQLRVYFYAKALPEHITIPLSKGSWQSEPQTVGETVYYPMVVSRETSPYKMGSRHRIQLLNGTTVHIYICGVLNREQRFVNLSAVTNAVNADYLVGECDRNTVSLFGIEELYPSEVTHGMYVSETGPKFVFFDENLSEEDYMECYRYCRDQGFVYTYDALMEACREQLRQGYTFFLPLVLCLALLSIVGVISFTVLSVKNNTVYYSCFLLCGGTRRDCIRLSVFNLCWIALFGLLITLFVTGLFINAGVFDGWYQVTAANVCISLGLGACVPLLGWLVTVLLFKNKTNLQLLKAEA